MTKPLQTPAQGVFSGSQLRMGRAHKRPSIAFHHHIRQPKMPPSNGVGRLTYVGCTNFVVGHGTPPVCKTNLCRSNKFPARLMR